MKSGNEWEVTVPPGSAEEGCHRKSSISRSQEESGLMWDAHILELRNDAGRNDQGTQGMAETAADI